MINPAAAIAKSPAFLKLKSLAAKVPEKYNPKNWPPHVQVGMGIGAVAGSAGLVNNKLEENKRLQVEIERQKIDAKSLAALQKIHAALSKDKTAVNA